MNVQDGIMQQIEQLLRDGKSSRQVIDMRYKPSSVYKVQRRVRARASAPITEGNVQPLPRPGWEMNTFIRKSNHTPKCLN